MIVDIKVPEVGESITEGFLLEWKKGDGETVAVDDDLFELETDKITMTIQAENSGKLKINVPAGSNIEIGQVVGSIDTEFKPEESVEIKEETESIEKEPDIPEPAISPTAGMEQVKAKLEDNSNLELFSPSARRIVFEHDLDPSAIKGTGKGGRVLKEDVLNVVENDKSSDESISVKIRPPKIELKEDKKEVKQVVQPVDVPESGERQVRKPMTRLRQRIAERLVQAQQNAAILTTFNEVDMSSVIEMRKRHQDAFLNKYGVKLGFMSFFVKASIEALKKVPMMNAQIDGNDIIENKFYDIGLAVSTEQGLVVPVVRDADKLSFGEIEQVIMDLGQRARDRKLSLDELQGGTFTISNGGIFGSMLSTPILNPPQSGILGMHAIKKRAVVLEPDDRIEVRPMMYLAVSYDHRIIDGAESVTFLKHIKDCIENPERIMLNI